MLAGALPLGYGVSLPPGSYAALPPKAVAVSPGVYGVFDAGSGTYGAFRLPGSVPAFKSLNTE